MTQETQSQTVNIDGVNYTIDELSPQIRQAVGIYNTFNQQLQTEQLAVIKTQAALQQLGNQIIDAIKKEKAEKATAEK